MIKKVVIAAAGQGTRMLHLTKNKSKHLIKVRKKPFLAYVLDNLKKAGYKEFILVAGYEIDRMKDFIKERKYKAVVVDQFKILGPKKKIYGTACPLMCVKDIVKKEQFLFICGDNLYAPKDLKAMNVADKYNYVAGLIHQHPEKYGVLIRNGQDFLDKIIEKPATYAGDLINTGLYKFTPAVFKRLPLVEKSARNEYELTDVINLLALEKRVKIKEIEDYWLDFGKPDDIKTIEDFLKNNHHNQKYG